MHELNSRELSMLKTYARLCGGAGNIENILELYRVYDPNVNIEEKYLLDAERLYKSTYKNELEINDTIDKNLENWTLDRVDTVDLAVMQIAINELNSGKTGTAIIINEAVELAKKYGSENSFSFVNGVLGSVVRAKDI